MLTPVPLLLAFALHAQDADFFTLGTDHAKFARELYTAGYIELAETFCTKIENSPAATPDEVASVRSVHLDLKIAQAKLQKESRAKLTALAQLLKEKEEFIDAYPDSREAKDARETLPDVYASVGEAYADSVTEVKDDPGEAKRLRGEGSEVFRRGEQALADQIEGLQAALEDTSLDPTQLEALEIELMTARYNQGRTFFFHAMLLGKDDPFGKTFYERCIEVFGEFGLEYEGTLLYFQGQVFQGQANAALGLTDDALDSFDECLRLKETFGADEDMPETTIQVLAWGAQEKIKLLSELKRYDEAIATANDFLKTVKGAAAVRQDLSVLYARLEAEKAKGDTAASQATAKLLDEKDPNGYFGSRGREVLGNLVASGEGGLDGKNLLKFAQSQFAKKDYEQALNLCNQAINASRAAGRKEDLTETFILAASCYWWLDRVEEAAVAYDAAAESNPTAERAGDALYSASLAYDDRYKKTRRAFYEKRSDDRLQKLATRFPKNPHSSEHVLSAAKKLAANDQFAEAAAAYLKIPTDSSAYPGAQYGAALALYSDAQRLAKEKSPDTKAAAAKAETQMRQARTVLETAAGKTLDLKEKATLESNAFRMVSLMGNLYMLEAVGRQNDALALTKEIEDKYPGDEEKIGEARSLRVRALTALGKLKDAEDYLEGLVAADSSSRSTAQAAGVLARTLDQQATELITKDKASTAADALWKQAFRYYVLSMKPKLNDSGVGDELEQVANRLKIMGERFNGVPENVTSFIGLKENFRATAPEYWEAAVDFYTPPANAGSFKARVNLAQTLCYLGRFADAVDIYSGIVENETLIDPATSEINRAALTGRPELLLVYLELGVAQYERGRAEKDDGQISNANVIFGQIGKVATKLTSETWWRARYYFHLTQYEVGLYEKCLAGLNDLQRNSSDDFDDGKYGLNTRFKELKRNVERKVVDVGIKKSMQLPEPKPK